MTLKSESNRGWPAASRRLSGKSLRSSSPSFRRLVLLVLLSVGRLPAQTTPAVDPAIGTARFGNAGRNILIGPGLNTMDVSLAKSFRLREKASLSFRLEAFNAMNHANYDIPNNNISTANLVGVVSGTITPARQMQFAVRLDF